MTIADAIRQAVQEDVANRLLDALDTARQYSADPFCSGWSFGGTFLSRVDEDGTRIRIAIQVMED